MSRLVDVVLSDEEVQVYARQAYLAFVRYQQDVKNIGEPRWGHLRNDLKSIWLGQARVTLSVYAYARNPVSDDDLPFGADPADLHARDYS